MFAFTIPMATGWRCGKTGKHYEEAFLLRLRDRMRLLQRCLSQPEIVRYPHVTKCLAA
jgi:hypothetical protein